MKHSQLIVAIAALSIVGMGCAKKNVAMKPPAEPPAAAPASTPQTASAPARATESYKAPASTPTPAAKYPDAVTRARIDQLLARIEDAYFDYDKATLRPDALKALEADSTELRDILKSFPEYKLTIEGHCDERGSAEYNMALGNKRAEAAKDYLVKVGIPAGQLPIMSYGKERPVCEDHDEACWQKNRRTHIVAQAQ